MSDRSQQQRRYGCLVTECEVRPLSVAMAESCTSENFVPLVSAVIKYDQLLRFIQLGLVRC